MRGILLLLILLGLSSALADDSGSSPVNRPAAGKAGKNKPAANAAKPLPITPERESAALAFVNEHHAELAELLIHLKESSPKDYERAIRDLSRASERLSQIRERDLEAYELELKMWQARSRAQLLNARLQMGDDDEIRAKLREALGEEYDLRLQLLSRERDRFADRVKNLDQQIERLTQRRTEGVEGQFQQMTKAARKATGNAKTPAKTKAAPNKKK